MPCTNRIGLEPCSAVAGLQLRHSIATPLESCTTWRVTGIAAVAWRSITIAQAIGRRTRLMRALACAAAHAYRSYDLYTIRIEHIQKKGNSSDAASAATPPSRLHATPHVYPRPSRALLYLGNFARTGIGGWGGGWAAAKPLPYLYLRLPSGCAAPKGRFDYVVGQSLAPLVSLQPAGSWGPCRAIYLFW